jgi:L-malate glycosyltransferase
MKRKRLRVLFVIGTLDIGGAETQLVRLASGLQERGHVVAICCQTAFGPLAEVARGRGIAVHCLHLRNLNPWKAPLEIARAILAFMAYCREFRPDVVHAFLFWGYIFASGLARVCSVPAVVAGRRGLSRTVRTRPAFVGMQVAASRLCDAIVANSEAVRRDALETDGLDPGKVHVIPNGLDVPVVLPGAREEIRRELGLEDASRTVFVVANFIHYKGHSTFLEAWANLAEQCPSAVAVLVGDGPMRPEIEKQIARLGLGGSVKLLGTVSDAARLLPAADVVVQASLEEGFPNAVLEAMAVGRPVVATAVGGTPEAVEDRVTGLLVPAGDAPALALAIKALLSEPDVAEAMGRAGKVRSARWSSARMVEEYEELYGDLVEAGCDR